MIVTIYVNIITMSIKRMDFMFIICRYQIASRIAIPLQSLFTSFSNYKQRYRSHQQSIYNNYRFFCLFIKTRCYSLTMYHFLNVRYVSNVNQHQFSYYYYQRNSSALNLFYIPEKTKKNHVFIFCFVVLCHLCHKSISFFV